MASMQPAKRDGQDIVFDNGIPVAISRADGSSVVVMPVTSATGRYQIGDRVSFLVLVRNNSSARVEISEENFTLTANDTHARTVTAVEMEDKIRSDAAWARAANGFSAVLSSMGAAATAGRSTATVRSNGSIAYVSVTDHGEQQRVQREIARDHREASDAITAREQFDVASLARVLQRNTLGPGAQVGGFVVLDVPRASACFKWAPSQAGASSRPDQATAGAMMVKESIPCHFTLTARVGGDTHSFVFDETFSGG
jgi:hypothetical protein